MSLSAGTRLGPYEIVAPLGAGGMGEVYRARDTRLGRDVAIKVVHPRLAADPDRLSRFEKEARAAAQLDHPNILVVHDVGTHEGSPFIVSELLQGESLRERLAKGPLPQHSAVELGVEIAHGLAAAHAKGIVHRDLKPANIFVTGDGVVKLLDFGLAKLTRPEAAVTPNGTTVDREPKTESGTVLGTMGYTSPEQLRGEAADARSDIFAFGCVLYEMLSGKSPFLKQTGAETVTAIMSEDPEPLSGTDRAIAPALREIVKRCLEKRADDRFSSAHDIALALRAFSEPGEGAEAAAGAVAAAIEKRPRRTAIAAVGVAVAVVVAVAGALIFANRKHAAVSSGLPSLLALPCTVYGAPEVAFLTDAVPGTISTLLSQVEGLDTKVPPTSFEVEKVKGDLTKLAELYQVSSFIVTSLTASPGRFTLNVQLVDAATRKVRWGKQYEGPRETYNDLARQAAEGLRLAVRPAALPVPTSTVSSEAELALREGDYFLNRYINLDHPQDFDAGIAAYHRALKEDPSLATAAAGVSELYGEKQSNEGEASGAFKEWEPWIRRALEIDGRCGRAWASLSAMEWYRRKPDIERQLEYALKAASFSPRDALSHMAVSNAVGSPGAFSLQLAAGLSAVDVDPFFLPGSGNVVLALSALGRPEEALPFADRILRVEPDTWLEYTKGYVLLKLGRFEEARKTLARWESQFLENPNSFNGQMWGQIRFQVAAAERDAATIEKLERFIVPPLLDGRADALTLENGTQFVCPALALLGRTDESIRILLRSVEVRVPPPYDFILYEPGFQPLRSDPRFAKVLTASRDGAAMVARILGEARARGELPKYLEAPLDDLLKLLNEKGAKS